MGRKANWGDKPKSGPGRKARKQPPPSFPGLSAGNQDGGRVRKSPGKNKGRFGKSQGQSQNNRNRKVKTFGNEMLKPGMPFRKEHLGAGTRTPPASRNGNGASKKNLT